MTQQQKKDDTLKKLGILGLVLIALGALLFVFTKYQRAKNKEKDGGSSGDRK
jgi:uncharacterized membrane protein